MWIPQVSVLGGKYKSGVSLCPVLGYSECSLPFPIIINCLNDRTPQTAGREGGGEKLVSSRFSIVCECLCMHNYMWHILPKHFLVIQLLYHPGLGLEILFPYAWTVCQNCGT